jgi:hypothetical protein
MSIRFGEVQQSSGLDVGAKAMILPIHGSNIIKVFGAPTLSLFDDRGILAIRELDTAAALSDKFIIYGLAAAMNVGDPGAVAAIQLKMAEHARSEQLDNPESIYRACTDMKLFNQEVLRVFFLDTRYRHSSTVEITKGSINESLAHPRDIFRPVIGQSAYAFVLVHNL